MMRNPTLSREMEVSSRSVRLPVIIPLSNGILSLVTLLNTYSVMAQVRTTAAIQYSSFTDIYELVTATELILLMFIVPAVTASSISRERERQTLGLMLTIQTTAFQAVTRKLMSALNTFLLLIVSSFPTVAMVFAYRGVTWGDAVSLLLYYITVAFSAGSVGFYFSALLKCSTTSMVVTYGVPVVMVAGAYFINKFTLSLSSMNTNNSMATYGFGESAVKTTFGGALHLLLLNPAVTFLAILNSQVRGSAPLTKIKNYFDMTTTNPTTGNWIMVSILIQLALAILMIYIAVRCVEPIKHRYKSGEKGVNHGNC